eukprot:SM000471S16661  [mRNA]  locus=s471:1677:7329:- [translate_table: standard]
MPPAGPPPLPISFPPPPLPTTPPPLQLLFSPPPPAGCIVGQARQRANGKRFSSIVYTLQRIAGELVGPRAHESRPRRGVG